MSNNETLKNNNEVLDFIFKATNTNNFNIRMDFTGNGEIFTTTVEFKQSQLKVIDTHNIDILALSMSKMFQNLISNLDLNDEQIQMLPEELRINKIMADKIKNIEKNT